MMGDGGYVLQIVSSAVIKNGVTEWISPSAVVRFLLILPCIIFLSLPSLLPALQTPYCVSLNWSADGATLYGGYTDGYIRVWTVGRPF